MQGNGERGLAARRQRVAKYPRQFGGWDTFLGPHLNVHHPLSIKDVIRTKGIAYVNDSHRFRLCKSFSGLIMYAKFALCNSDVTDFKKLDFVENNNDFRVL